MIDDSSTAALLWSGAPGNGDEGSTGGDEEHDQPERGAEIVARLRQLRLERRQRCCGGRKRWLRSR